MKRSALGYIRCRDKTPGPFDADDRAILTQLAHMASTAVENARLYGEMRQADVRKDEFLATLAHELRNPLAPIHHALQLMRQSTDPDELRTNREVIERQVRQLVHLVDDLLDVSRVSRGKLDLRRRLVTLAEVLSSSIETSRPLIEAQGHALTLTLPPEPVWLHGRPDAAGAGVLQPAQQQRQIHRARRTDCRVGVGHGPDVQISVRDNGIGISAEMLPHVFDVFRQARQRRRACARRSGHRPDAGAPDRRTARRPRGRVQRPACIRAASSSCACPADAPPPQEADYD